MFFVEVFYEDSDLPVESHHYLDKEAAIQRFNKYADILVDYKLFDRLVIRNDNVVIFDTKGIL